ncbi:hypothetical protein DOTSEDRAFT_28976 [Dothistroma septosporum NZE10]|uniref:Uncharacterized protein n=1 Tax=Dothistroma septosporum (strain NZE10 / CBS 128990) TaxID=675120 RepID=M2WIF4_DOTSN|nr:hypothetical protein DOTSEDRAFT_28976 [Dothistroma septosporum NZE10]
MSSAKESKLEQFLLSSDQHVRAQECARLLTVLDDALDSTSAKATKPASPVFSRTITSHCNLIAGDCDANAIVILGKPMTDDGVGRFPDTRINIVVNYYCEDGDDQPATSLEMVKGASFDVHVADYYRYLRAIHAASDDSAHVDAGSQFRDFVYMTSYPKILLKILADADSESLPRPYYPDSHLSMSPEQDAKNNVQARLIRTELESRYVSSDTVKRRTKIPFYDSPEDRANLQVSFANHLINARRGLEELDNVMATLQISRLRIRCSISK